MLTRREFLKSAFGAFCALRLPDVEKYNIPKLPGQEWIFPLAFPAWFPVEPRVDSNPLKHKVYVPMAK